jgi:hypothetical protein
MGQAVGDFKFEGVNSLIFLGQAVRNENVCGYLLQNHAAYHTYLEYIKHFRP